MVVSQKLQIMSHLLKSTFFREEPNKKLIKNEMNKIVLHFCFDAFLNHI